MIVVHRVYWTEDGLIKSKDFGENSIDQTLKFCEELRKLRISGSDISFITISSEIPECTSLSGISEVDDNYNWTKRRRGRK